MQAGHPILSGHLQRPCRSNLGGPHLDERFEGEEEAVGGRSLDRKLLHCLLCDLVAAVHVLFRLTQCLFLACRSLVGLRKLHVPAIPISLQAPNASFINLNLFRGMILLLSLADMLY